MFNLYSCNYYRDASGPEKNIVAEFTTEALANEYIDGVTLEVFPNGNRRFRRNSLLGCAGWAEVEKKNEPERVPINPTPPDEPPGIEYLVVIPFADYGETMKISCGYKREVAEKELELYKVKGAFIEERNV